MFLMRLKARKSEKQAYLQGTSSFKLNKLNIVKVFLCNTRSTQKTNFRELIIIFLHMLGDILTSVSGTYNSKHGSRH